MFNRFKDAELREVTENEFWKLVFVYSIDNPVSIKLTKSGNERLIKQVAKEYLKQTSDGYTWDANEKKVKPMLEKLSRYLNLSFPPLFLREKFSNEPASGSYYIEDGIHRTLALSAFCLQRNKKPKIKAYIGYFNQ